MTTRRRATARGRVALVTGAETAPGAAIAEALREAGAIVIVAGGETPAFAPARRDRRGVAALALDVTDDLSWAAGLFDVIERFGGLDVLVNAAGAAPAPLGATAPAERLFAINLAGACRGAQQAAAAMRPDGAAGRGGVVLNVAATAPRGPARMSAAALAAASDALRRESEAGGWGVRIACLEIAPEAVPRAVAQAALAAIEGEAAPRRVAC